MNDCPLCQLEQLQKERDFWRDKHNSLLKSIREAFPCPAIAQASLELLLKQLINSKELDKNCLNMWLQETISALKQIQQINEMANRES